tara:strand:+ start:904 stop:1314 length:411 start_codon:yes stop_codon:yes gene_type:complete
MNWILHSQGTFHADPVALGRPRMSRWGAYTPKKSVEYQREMLQGIEIDHEPITGPIKVSMSFCHKRPGRLNRKKDTVARIPKVTKPDIDNMIKMVLDVLTKAGAWNDDNQVVCVTAEDWYCSKSEEPHTQWRIYTL